VEAAAQTHLDHRPFHAASCERLERQGCAHLEEGAILPLGQALDALEPRFEERLVGPVSAHPDALAEIHEVRRCEEAGFEAGGASGPALPTAAKPRCERQKNSSRRETSSRICLRWTMRSTKPFSSTNSARWKPGGRSSPMVWRITRAPANPTSALGSATITPPSEAKDASTPAVEGSVRIETNGRRSRSSPVRRAEVLAI